MDIKVDIEPRKTPTDENPERPSSFTKETENEDETTIDITHDDDDNETGDQNKESEIQETKKPLLDEDENKSVDVVVIGNNDDEDISETNDTPTLPISSKKTPDEADKEEERPSIFTQPFARMKYDWEHSSNVLEFFTRVICIVFGSIGWLVLVGGIPFISIIELIIGAVYIHDCPADPRIPEYLIVTGVFGTILHFVSAFTKYGPKLAPKSTQKSIKAHRGRCICIEAIVQIFLFVWFIAGCVWVYRIYKPNYDDPESAQYCHKGLYLFTFWILNICLIIISIIVVIALCFIGVAIGLCCIGLKTLKTIVSDEKDSDKNDSVEKDSDEKDLDEKDSEKKDSDEKDPEEKDSDEKDPEEKATKEKTIEEKTHNISLKE